MKKMILVSTAILSVLLYSCDKVTNAYPKNSGGNGELDWSLYPDGDSANYAQNHWPVWSPNTNTLTNALIEDFTGHRCFNCPKAADTAHAIFNSYPGRIVVASIHSSNNGLSDFQEKYIDPNDPNLSYPEILYNDLSLEIGTYIGQKPGSGFVGNPRVAVNRMLTGTDNTSSIGTMRSKCITQMAIPVKVNIQAEHNYFASTRGLFLHTEVDVVDASITSQLGLVVYVLEDSLIAPQLMPDVTRNPNYVHRDILRGCIDGKAFGRTLKATDLGSNGKYYVNYSYKVPAEYDPANLHLVIYVYDKTTDVIYQVIEEKVE